MSIGDTTAIALTLIGLFQLLATGVIAWVIQRGTSKLARVELSRTLRETWITIDSLALRDEQTLAIADSLLPKYPKEGAKGVARKRLFLLAYLNPIATWHQGVVEGIYGSKETDNLRVVRGLLTEVLNDEDAYWVSQTHWYDQPFQELCEEIHASLVGDRTLGVSA